MNYYFNKTIKEGFDEVIDRVTVDLKSEGFGVLTEIDMKKTFKSKLNVELRN